MNETRAALTALFRASHAEVHGVVLGRCGDRALAEDITAQAFEEAAVRFAQGRAAEVTTGWLVTVAKRRLIDHWRRSGRGSVARERLQIEATASVPPTDSDPQLWAALDSLPMKQRAVLVLRYLDDWSVSEIADGLDLSYRAAESLLARARKSLRTALEANGGEW